jgi:hypothetical protein
MNSGFARMGDTRRLPLHTVRAARKTLVEDGFSQLPAAFRKRVDT